VELIQAFRQAANNLNVDLKIYGADMAGTAPALFFCDYTRIVCGMREENYISQLLKICQDDNIDMLIPTIDTDLLILSQNAEKFDKIGTKVLISKSDKIAICRDKNFTADFFVSCGLKAPVTVNDYQLYKGTYPCFIKPKDGSSSINAFKVENESELKVYADQVGDYIVQPFIEGTEYTVDIFCDYDGNPIFITPRVRLAVRAGEVLKTKISMDKKIIEECRKLIEKFKPCGAMTVQLIRQNTTGDDYYIEINPRFGGGAPLSMKAGARSAEAILKMLSGEVVGYTEAVDDGAVYSRFDQSVRIS
jgi:carbamoylphosphate synthase large subunit